MNIPELLAPAGSVETFRAGFEAGADAFYLGFGNFNARKRAKNFTEDELRLAAEFAHHHGRRIYLTMNTLVFDRELDAVLNLLELAREIRADAIIVQDWGVISLLRDFFPEIPIHASTQMFCHNSLHAEFLRDQGIRRIILPRELSLDEMGIMMKQVPLEYEVFVHGAMCFSFSGCCLASSWLYGESGNRGECRQVCRFPYRCKNIECYPFSMKDINALDYINEFIKLGVSSLKIEGRLKNASYVAETVSAYRAVLDAVKDGRSLPSSPQLSRQRETGKGYFRDKPDYSRLVSHESSGTAGDIFGKVLSIDGKEIRIIETARASKGLRLRVQDVRGRNLFEGVLLDFWKDKSLKSDTIVWKTKESVRTSGFVEPFMVYSIGMSAPSDAVGFLKGQVKKITIAKISIRLHITIGKVILSASSTSVKSIFEREYPLATEVSKNRPLAKEECIRIFSQTDKLPYFIDQIDCKIEENLFCPVGTLKDIRRAFYAEFNAWLIGLITTEKNKRRKALVQKLDTIKNSYISSQELKTFIYPNIPIPFQEEREPDYVAYPLELNHPPHTVDNSKTILILPHFISEGMIVEWKKRIAEMIQLGYTRFLAPTYGWLELNTNYPQVEFIAGPYLYMVNSLAVEFMENKGGKSFIISPDISKKDVETLLNFRGCVVPLNPPREFFITRLQIPEGEYRFKGIVLRPIHFDEYTVIEEKSPHN